MFGQSLLLGTGISGISTGVYAVMTNDKYNNEDRNNEYISIFCIILVISFLILFIFHRSSESLVETNNIIGNGFLPTISGKPPF